MQNVQNSIKQVTRLGVYAIAVLDQQILLIEKKDGYYGGLLDLPGGGVEFGENPEEALRREFKEEVAMRFKSMKLISNLSHRGMATHTKPHFDFHHVGLIYHVEEFEEIKNVVPEETFSWHSLKQLDLTKLTPFARESVEPFLR
jgi:8-oxo-dGTP diphosphatase